MTTEARFRGVIEATDPAPDRRAKSGAIGAPNAAPQPSATVREASQAEAETALLPEGDAVSSADAENCLKNLVGSTGREQPASRAVDARVTSGCDAKCDAISRDRVELLARAVILVASMATAEAAREAVLARVPAKLANAAEQQQPPPARAGEVIGHRRGALYRSSCPAVAGAFIMQLWNTTGRALRAMPLIETTGCLPRQPPSGRR